MQQQVQRSVSSIRTVAMRGAAVPCSPSKSTMFTSMPGTRERQVNKFTLNVVALPCLLAGWQYGRLYKNGNNNGGKGRHYKIIVQESILEVLWVGGTQ